jgi:hypothetical protein
MNTPLEWGEGSASRPGRSLPLGKTRYPLCRRLGGPHDQSEQVRKISPLPGFDPRTVRPLAGRYTDYATRPTYREGHEQNSDKTRGKRQNTAHNYIIMNFTFYSIFMKCNEIDLSRNIRWVRHVGRMAEYIDAFKSLVLEPKENLKGQDVDRRIILK